MLLAQLVRIWIALPSSRRGRKASAQCSCSRGIKTLNRLKWHAEENPDALTSEVLGRTPCDIHEDVVWMLPGRNSLKKQVNRTQNRHWPPNPTSLHGFETPEEYKVAEHRESFLVHDPGAQHDKRILIYTIYDNIDLCTNNKITCSSRLTIKFYYNHKLNWKILAPFFLYPGKFRLGLEWLVFLKVV